MKITKASFLYAILCNVPVSACLCLAANLSNNSGAFALNDFLFNYAISLPLAICISLFFPLIKVGKWFTSLFGFKTDTFTHNIMYRVLAILCYSFIYFFILNPILAICNGFFYNSWISLPLWFFNWMRSLPTMIMVGFCSSFFFDIPAFKIAHHIDSSF